MENPVCYILSIAQISLSDLTREQQAGLGLSKFGLDGKANGNSDHPTAAPAPSNAWLFQSNPVLYDLHGALRSLPEQVWSVSRYARQIRRGDRVYLWEAGREGGVAGVAEITESARLRPEPTEQFPFARVAEAFAGERMRAKLKVLRVIEPVVPRREIIASPELSGLGVLRCSRGTNFRLSIAQWQALNSLTVEGAA